MILNYRDQSYLMSSMMKNKHDSDLTAHTSAVYAKNNIKLLWLIRSGVDYDEHQRGQLCD